MASPFANSRKRDRDNLLQEDLVSSQHGNSEQDSLLNLSDLTVEELNVAQSMARTLIQSSCFLSIETGSEYNKTNPFAAPSKSFRNRVESNPFIDSEDFEGDFSNPSTPKSSCLTLSEEVDHSEYALLLHTIVPLFLKQADVNPTMISLESKMCARAIEIRDWIVKNNVELVISLQDSMAMGRVVSKILLECKVLIPSVLWPVCQSILAVNQSTESSRKIKGSVLNIPTSKVKTMIRNVMILLPPLCRQMLEYLINFFCELSRKSSVNARNSWAKQLAKIGGNLIDAQPWAVLFFELLMHSHGLTGDATDLSNGIAKRLIWCLDLQFEKELRERLKVIRTPSRRNIMTPRKSVNRQYFMSNVNKRGSALRKNLFGKPVIPEVPTSPTFVATQNGKYGDPLERDLYAKRRKLR